METFGRFKLVIVVFLAMVLSCDSEDQLAEELEDLKEEMVPDSRTLLFDFYLDHGILRGKTTSALVFEKVENLLREDYPKIIDSLYVLPSFELGADTLGIITVSVANIRSEPRHSAELSTQALMGTPVKLLEKTGSWYLVQTPDQYLGYLEAGVIVQNAQWERAVKRVFQSPLGFIRESPSEESRVVSDLCLGDLLGFEGSMGSYSKVFLPDGRSGYVASSDLAEIPAFLAPESDLSEASSAFLGVPYLWGGTSFKGMDCSGFSRTLFLEEGIYLPRDASQQALVGDLIETDSTFSQLVTGDLLFFGRDNDHISHVAVYLGNKRFIHASGWVKYGSFDPDSPNYDGYNLSRFRFARRMLHSQNVERLNDDTFYNL